MDLGSDGNPLQVAIVGSGPSGFYAAEALLRGRSGIRIDMFDRLPTPFGLVRGGVAPDHPEDQGKSRRLRQDRALPGFRFFGNVEIGTDVTVERAARALRSHRLRRGRTRTDKHLGIPARICRATTTAT